MDNKIIESLKEVFKVFDCVNGSNINFTDKVKIESILVKNMLYKHTQLKQQLNKASICHLYHERIDNRVKLLKLDKYIDKGEFY